MKLSWTVMVLVMLAARLAAGEEPVQLVSGRETACVFAGEARKISVIWQNTGDRTVKTDVQVRIYQASSATSVLWREWPWKKLQLLPHQTVVDAATLDFPPVKAETRFLVQWVGASHEVLGVTDVRVYPTNLLAELSSLAHHKPIGVFDPLNELKPLLASLKIEFVDLEDNNFKDFAGPLAVVGPFASRARVRDGLAGQIGLAAKRGTAIVWFSPPDERMGKLLPSFYSVPVSAGSVLVAQPELAADLSDSPRAQKNLVALCRLALHPQPLTLPELSGP